MNTTIESVKDEVAKTYCRIGGQPKCSSWEHFIEDRVMNEDPDNEISKATSEVIQLYHSRKCEEAGSEVSSQKIFNGAWWVSLIEAEKLLASKQSQLEAKDKRIEDLCKELNQYSENYAKAVSSLQDSKAEIEKLKESNEEYLDGNNNLRIINDQLKSQLQEAKAKAESSNKLLENASYWLSSAVDIFNGSSGLNTGKEDKYCKMVECCDRIQEFINKEIQQSPNTPTHGKE